MWRHVRAVLRLGRIITKTVDARKDITADGQQKIAFLNTRCSRIYFGAFLPLPKGCVPFMEFIPTENEQQVTDAVILEISENLIAKNRQAYKELARYKEI